MTLFLQKTKTYKKHRNAVKIAQNPPIGHSGFVEKSKKLSDESC